MNTVQYNRYSKWAIEAKHTSLNFELTFEGNGKKESNNNDKHVTCVCAIEPNTKKGKTVLI